MTYAQSMDLGLISAHQLGARVDGVKHACPECGVWALVECVTCRGTGLVTEEELARWQMVVNSGRLLSPLGIKP